MWGRGGPCWSIARTSIFGGPGWDPEVMPISFRAAPPPPQPADDIVLWTVRRQSRVDRAVVRMLPRGRGLRLLARLRFALMGSRRPSPTGAPIACARGTRAAGPTMRLIGPRRSKRQPTPEQTCCRNALERFGEAFAAPPGWARGLRSFERFSTALIIASSRSSSPRSNSSRHAACFAVSAASQVSRAAKSASSSMSISVVAFRSWSRQTR